MKPKPLAMRVSSSGTSKYRNTKCTVDGESYRSKREAQRHRMEQAALTARPVS